MCGPSNARIAGLNNAEDMYSVSSVVCCVFGGFCDLIRGVLPGVCVCVCVCVSACDLETSSMLWSGSDLGCCTVIEGAGVLSLGL